MIKFETINMIDVGAWDMLVTKTYGRIYSFQQQDGCKERGIEYFNVPQVKIFDYKNNSVPEVVNGDKMGVAFNAWLSRDPKQKINNQSYDRALELWWERNFYPSLDSIANDLYNKGLLPAGKYGIHIDW